MKEREICSMAIENGISLIVPCYNEQEVLPIFYREVTKVMQGINYEYELLFVNDGSKDDTLKELREIASADNHVKYISSYLLFTMSKSSI